MGSRIDLSTFGCFQTFNKLFVIHLRKKNIPEIDEIRMNIRDGFPWIFRRSSCEARNLLSQISEYELIFLLFVYGLVNDLKDLTLTLYEIIQGIDENVWQCVISILEDIFKMSEEELYLIVKNISVHPDIAVSLLPQPIIKYIQDISASNGFLYESCLEGNVEAVKCLMLCEVPVTVSSLHAATKNGYGEVVNVLLDNGAKFYWSNVTGHSALHVAAEEGHIDIVKSFLSAAPTTEMKYNNGMTLLHIAVKNRHTEMVKFLLEKNFDLSVTTNQSETPLHLACKNGDEEISSILIEWGANVNFVSNEIKTPLHIAVEKNSLAIVRMILHTNYADVDLEMVDGNTALHIACESDFRDIAEALLSKGGSSSVKNFDGNTASHLAAAVGHVAVCELLGQFGCLFGELNHRREQPLHLAIVNGRIAIVEFLLSVMSDIDCQDNGGKTPLHLAAYHGRMKILMLLLNRGASLDKISKNGYKAVHFAAEQGHAMVVETLFLQGADVTCRTQNPNPRRITGYLGLTPLELATRAKRHNVVSLLSQVKEDSSQSPVPPTTWEYLKSFWPY